MGDERTATTCTVIEELTIVTVCIAKHYQYVRQQIDLIDALNPGANWKLVIVDNTNSGVPNLVIDDPRCTVLAGVPFDNTKPENCRGSYHHAAALNEVIKTVSTRFLLVLDPDLFVVYRQWIRECIQHMVRNDLSFFGVPWHPRWYMKYRYYPCVHFLVIDRLKISERPLDFMPAIVEQPTWVDRMYRWMKEAQLKQRSGKSSAKWTVRRFGESFAAGMISRAFNRLNLVLGRHRIHCSRDTGWRLWEEFGRTGRFPADTALPVVDLRAELTKPKHLLKPWGIRLERCLPKRLSFLPPAGTYVEPKRAVGFELREFGQLEPESFVWRGAPFAFHLRGHVRDLVKGAKKVENEQPLLARLLVKVKSAPCWFLWENEPRTKAAKAGKKR